MPRVIFTEDFSYKPVAQQTFLYKKGEVLLVSQAIADKAIYKNKAKLTDFEAPPASIRDTIKRFPNRKKKKLANEKVISSPEEAVIEIATFLNE